MKVCELSFYVHYEDSLVKQPSSFIKIQCKRKESIWIFNFYKYSLILNGMLWRCIITL